VVVVAVAVAGAPFLHPLLHLLAAAVAAVAAAVAAAAVAAVVVVAAAPLVGVAVAARLAAAVAEAPLAAIQSSPKLTYSHGKHCTQASSLYGQMVCLWRPAALRYGRRNIRSLRLLPKHGSSSLSMQSWICGKPHSPGSQSVRGC